MSDKQVLMELQMIREGRQKIKEAHVPLTPIEQEIENDRETWLERCHTEWVILADKSNLPRSLRLSNDKQTK